MAPYFLLRDAFYQDLPVICLRVNYRFFHPLYGGMKRLAGIASHNKYFKIVLKNTYLKDLKLMTDPCQCQIGNFNLGSFCRS